VTAHQAMLYQKLSQRQDKQKEQVLTEFAVAQQMKLKEMLDSLVARLEREEGQDMIEYALLAALISIVAIAVIILVGPYLRNLFQDVVNALASA
jgi:pilus assembly protein Flp/PilA